MNFDHFVVCVGGGGNGGKERPFQLKKFFHKTLDTARTSHDLTFSFGSNLRKHSLRTTLPCQIPSLLDLLFSSNPRLIQLANHHHKVWKVNDEDHHILVAASLKGR